MSLNAVAKESGLSASQVSQIELSRRPDPGFRTIARLAKGLKLSLDELAAAVGLAEPVAGKSLAQSAREVLALRRELEAIKTEALKLAGRAEKALGPDKPASKRPRK
jgi:transcriptional regulator with XRE-family HTH domain